MNTGRRSRKQRSAAVPAAAAASEPERWKFVASSRVRSRCGRDDRAPGEILVAREEIAGLYRATEPQPKEQGRLGRSEESGKRARNFRTAFVRWVQKETDDFGYRRAPPSLGDAAEFGREISGQSNGKVTNWGRGGRGMKNPRGRRRLCRAVVQGGGAATEGARLCPPRTSRSSPETSWTALKISRFPCAKPAAAGAPPTQPRSGKNPRGPRGCRSAAVPAAAAPHLRQRRKFSAPRLRCCRWGRDGRAPLVAAPLLDRSRFPRRFGVYRKDFPSLTARRPGGAGWDWRDRNARRLPGASSIGNCNCRAWPGL